MCTGIGNATARALDRGGLTVSATDDDPGEIEDLEAIDCKTRELDVTDEADAQAVVDEMDDAHGHVDLLFNITSYGQPAAFEEIPTERLEAQFVVNLFGMHRLLRAALPVMRRQDCDIILNMSSVYGRIVFVGQGANCASKWAVEAMSDALRSEVPHHDLNVVVLEPGPMETEFGGRAFEQLDHVEWSGAYEWFDDMYDDRSFLDEAAGSVHPEDVADGVVEITSAAVPNRRYAVGPWRYRLLVGTALPKPVRGAARDPLPDVQKRVV